MVSNMKNRVKAALSRVTHPEINHTLMELGMIGNLEVKKGKVKLTIMLPFANIPIKENLMAGVKEALKEIGRTIDVDISFAVMDQKQRDKFVSMQNLHGLDKGSSL